MGRTALRTWLQPILRDESIDLLPHILDLIPVTVWPPLPRFDWPAEHLRHGRHAAVREYGLLQVAPVTRKCGQYYHITVKILTNRRT